MTSSLKTFGALATLGVAVALVTSLSRPVDSAGFALLGGELDQGQRDFRVFNNFADPQTNNNTTPDPNFPGALGAVMAIWKGHVEWASQSYAGNGNGDPTQGNLGDGGANFDNSFQGEASAVGGLNENIHSALAGGDGSTLAFMEPGVTISDGWRIRYLDFWTWQDGPGSGGTDLQGVACHEVGHALGLDHSGVSAATMWPFGGGSSERSIHSDDIAGIQTIYGVKSGIKPTISGLSGSMTIGETLIITGSNFSDDKNVVWFTKENSNGVAKKVNNVSSTNGNTQLAVTIPTGITDGDVVVKAFFSGNESVSNAWPIDVEAPAPDASVLNQVNPNNGAAGGFTVTTLTGTGFSGATNVTFGGVDALSFTVDSSTQITATTPAGSQGSTVDVTVVDPAGNGTLVAAYTYGANPAPNISSATPGMGPPAGGTTVTISGSSVVGVSDVQFGGVSGTNLQVLSATDLEVDAPAGIGTVDIEAIGNGSSTLSAAFTYDDVGGFVNVGPGLAGALGAPVLTGYGDLTPGSPVGAVLSASNAQPFISGLLYLSTSEAAVPFKGGTFYPIPILFQIILPFDGTGSLDIPLAFDNTVPSGLSLVWQYWFQDATGPFGWTGSNGFRFDIP